MPTGGALLVARSELLTCTALELDNDRAAPSNRRALRSSRSDRQMPEIFDSAESPVVLSAAVLIRCHDENVPARRIRRSRKRLRITGTRCWSLNVAAGVADLYSPEGQDWRWKGKAGAQASQIRASLTVRRVAHL